MNKEEILNKLIIEDKISDALSVIGCDIILTTFYLNKLVEGGFISMDKNQLTVKGFDTSMDLIEAGWKLNVEEAYTSIESLLISGENDRFIAEMIISCQEIGLDGMLKEMEK